jgi:DNA helicase-2/ATP-dependent DNA helicase PcrA
MFQRLATYPEPFFNESQIIDIEARVARQQRRNKEDLIKAKTNDKDAKLKRIGPIAYLRKMIEKGVAQKNSDADRLISKVDEIREYLDTAPEAPFSRVADKLGIIAKARQSEKTEDHQISDFNRLADEMASQIGLSKTLASLTSLDFNAGRKGINVATMHGAKGLEYEIVALPGWQEGDFPSYQRKDAKDIEEERRVAYVAITRARKMLVISWSGSGNRPARPSMFVHEAGLIEGNS